MYSVLYSTVDSLLLFYSCSLVIAHSPHWQCTGFRTSETAITQLDMPPTVHIERQRVVKFITWVVEIRCVQSIEKAGLDKGVYERYKS